MWPVTDFQSCRLLTGLGRHFLCTIMYHSLPISAHLVDILAGSLADLLQRERTYDTVHWAFRTIKSALLLCIWPSLLQFSMTEKDISVLMSRLNLYSAQQQNTYTPTGGYNTDELKSHTKRRRNRPRLQKVRHEKESPNQNQKSNRRMGKDEQASKANNNTNTPGQPSPLKADSSSQAITGEQRASKDEFSAADSSSPKIWPAHV